MDNEAPVPEIVKAIENKMENKQRLIMVFSYGYATNNTMKAAAKILNKSSYKDYHYESDNNLEGEKPVHSSTFTLMD